MSWTIGDLATETGVLEKSIVTQGFQQPTISVREIDPNSLDQFNFKDPQPLGPVITTRSSDDFSAEVFPNPFGTDITIKVENSNQEYCLDIFDPAGNLVSRIRSSSPQEVIRLFDLPASQYVLRVSLVESRQSRVFQIIKSN